MFDEIHNNNFLDEKDFDAQIKNLSYTMAELNIIHPFREGNGRCIREFIRCMALSYGLKINWGNVDRDSLINASIASVYDENAFYNLLLNSIEKW